MICVHLKEKGVTDPGDDRDIVCDECFLWWLLWWLAKLAEVPQVKPRLRKLFEQSGIA